MASDPHQLNGNAASANAAESRNGTKKMRGVEIAWMLTACAIFVAFSLSFVHYVNDDAFITFRFSQFWVNGDGPYYNPGERVEGYTNFLLMALISVVIGVAGPEAALPFAKGIGFFAGLGCIVMTFLLAREVGWCRSRAVAYDYDSNVCQSDQPSGLPFLAAGLLAVQPNFALNSMSGLETTLFAFLIVLGVWLATLRIKRGWLLTGLIFGLACLTRPEGIYLAVVSLTAAVVLLRHAEGAGRRSNSDRLDVQDFDKADADLAHSGRNRFSHFVLSLFLVFVITSLHLFWRIKTYDSEWLPNTYYAKAGGFAATSPVEYVYRGAVVPFGRWWGIGLALIGLLLIRGGSRQLRVVVAVALAALVLPFLTGADWMLGSRLLIPVLPFLAIVVATGWLGVWKSVFARRRWLACFPVIAGPLLILAIQIPHALYLLHHTQARAVGYEKAHRALADWFVGSTAKPGDTIALMDIGIVGYVCIDQKILDITGLTDRHIAKSPGPFLAKEYNLDYVFDRSPEFIILTFGSASSPAEPPTLETISPWTSIEGKLFKHPRFRESYWTNRSPRSGTPWPDELAVAIGAERLYYHNYPGRHYLLAVYVRQDKQVLY